MFYSVKNVNYGRLKHSVQLLIPFISSVWVYSAVVDVDVQGFFFEGVLSAAFSDSDQFVFTGSKDRTVKVWDVATGMYRCNVFTEDIRKEYQLNSEYPAQSMEI